MIKIAAERSPAASFLFAVASVASRFERLSGRGCDAASVSVENNDADEKWTEKMCQWET